MAAPQIVTVNVSQTFAPAPNLLQKTGIIVSQGGTSTAVGTKTLITQFSDYATITEPGRTISTITWASGVVTVTSAAPHGFTTGDVLSMNITGVTPAGYNGLFNATVTGASTFTYPLATNPGTATVTGLFTDGDVVELTEQIDTFFAQGSSVSVYVLECGPGTPSEGASYLTTWMAANPLSAYLYLVPREWDGNSTFLSLVRLYENPTALTYFIVTTTTGTYSDYTSQMKDVIALIEAPGAQAVEFSAASVMYAILSYTPSTVDLITPLEYTYTFGTTPYPVAGNASLLTTLKAAFVNVIGTGAEGGISDTLIWWGTTMDGMPFNYWYAADWCQINLKLNIANEVINGANNPKAPLGYNQSGINRVQGRAQSTLKSATTFGMLQGGATVTAVPFAQYVTDNPNDYAIGKYAGLAATITPLRGFDSIIFQLNVTNFPSGS